MNKKISATTYGTIAMVGILALIGCLSSGWENIWSLLYFILGILGFAAITILLMKFIPEVWVTVIVAVPILTFLHVDIQSWLFTIIIGLYYYAAEFGGFEQEVNITDTDIQNTINEIEIDNNSVTANLSVEDDMVTCVLDVEATMTKEAAKNIGENCRRILAKEVTEDNQDLFYRRLTGSKTPTSKKRD